MTRDHSAPLASPEVQPSMADLWTARTVTFEPDYAAFSTDVDHRLVGYGMDHQRRFRGLDAVRSLEP